MRVQEAAAQLVPSRRARRFQAVDAHINATKAVVRDRRTKDDLPVAMIKGGLPLDLAKKARANGGELIPSVTCPENTSAARWDVAGKCEHPVLVRQDGGTVHELIVGSKACGGVRTAVHPPRTLDMVVPCRQCKACLRLRGRVWGGKAQREWLSATLNGCRTWFGTLTFDPGLRFQLLARTRARLEGQGIVLEDLPRVERFSEQARECGELVTLMFKRMRKGLKNPVELRQGRLAKPISPLAFRYFLAVEPHLDWTPHYHVLIHETDHQRPILWDALAFYWPHGHVVWKQVSDERGAFYAAKYLNKLSCARVRASQFYGEPRRSVGTDLSIDEVVNIDPQTSLSSFARKVKESGAGEAALVDSQEGIGTEHGLSSASL